MLQHLLGGHRPAPVMKPRVQFRVLNSVYVTDMQGLVSLAWALRHGASEVPPQKPIAAGAAVVRLVFVCARVARQQKTTKSQLLGDMV